MTGTVPETPIRPRRWTSWLLAGSLALNLLFTGTLAGLALRGGPDGSLMRAAIGALPDDARRDMRRDGREAFRSARDRADLRLARDQLLAALRAETFDEAGFRTGLDVAQARLVQMGDGLETRLVARLTQLDREARADVARRLEERTARYERD